MKMLTIKKIALGLALTTAVVAAKAQKTYTRGVATYNINAMGQDVEGKAYFTPDSSSFQYSAGPATIKMISTAKADYFAILVDVPVASMKKAAVATPGEIEESADSEPSYTFAPGTETKKIGDYNCTKYTAKDTKTGTSYDLWVTTDISAPANILTRSFASVKGVPVQFSYIPAGAKVAQLATLKSISDEKVPAGTFKIDASYDKISLSDLKAMGGRRQ
ncbi:hypothetical protein BEL04_06695 [Mucilaginibacter sp. PPCGB 2223]|uniref:hypothetical protein n=1 Tax=Mucilaginibacter sp. PPCGB 2223 TaxID=1886027 RepID=UPI0008263A0F|nr:hypothetical protein [Mucilaginibacter sp. PPCGB 2223]OCX53962.1 hypothetical protein BEL04_06695 [Mucilaginibacter sp. PPCGB 2223]